MRYYEELHAPQALRLFPMKKDLRNNAVVPPGTPKPDFDCITEFWYQTPRTRQPRRRLRDRQAISQTRPTSLDAHGRVCFQVEKRLSDWASHRQRYKRKEHP